MNIGYSDTKSMKTDGRFGLFSRFWVIVLHVLGIGICFGLFPRVDGFGSTDCHRSGFAESPHLCAFLERTR